MKTVNLELSKQLKEAGYPQKAERYWFNQDVVISKRERLTMREIKFRAWDLLHKRIIHDVWLINFYNETLVGDDQKVVSYVLMQFTGLTDKNGKEIYEGDIVKHSDYYIGDHKKKEGVILVEFIENGWNDELMAGYVDCPDWIEVVGNIYDNPELLPTEGKGKEL